MNDAKLTSRLNSYGVLFTRVTSIPELHFVCSGLSKFNSYGVPDSDCMTPEANEDIENVYHYIADILMSQEIAINYYIGINDTIHRLAVIGGIFAVSQREFLNIYFYFSL